MVGLHHVGVTVTDLDEAVEWYCRIMGLRVSRLESLTDVDPAAIGLPGEHVRLRGAELAIGDMRGPFLELHQFVNPAGEDITRRICDPGLSHFAFYTEDIHKEYDRLRQLGVNFNTPPRYISEGGLAGDWWVYFLDPWDNKLQLVSQARG